MLTRNRKLKRPSPPGAWKLQDAKAHFSEVVRRAQTDGPQRVTVHGKDAVVIVAAQDYAKANASTGKVRTGADLVAIMQKGRRLGLRIRPLRTFPPMRPPVTLTDNES